MSDPGSNTDDAWREYWSATPDNPYLSAEARVAGERIIDRYHISQQDVILDFGCGYGYVAEVLATAAKTVYVYDQVEATMQGALHRVSLPNLIAFDPASPDSVRFDLIVVNSVIQYMSPDVLARWLRRWRNWVEEDGAIAITDVPEASPSLFREGIELFWLALKNGVLLDAVEFARENSARYRSTRAGSELATFDEASLRRLAEGAGLNLEREPKNLAYQSGRSSFTLRVAEPQ